MLFTATLVVYIIGLHLEYQNIGRKVCNIHCLDRHSVYEGLLSMQMTQIISNPH